MNDPKTRLDSETKQLLTDLNAVVDRLQVKMLLIGARARGFIFDSQYNVEGRATTDWDVAVELDSWERYDALVIQMTALEAPRFCKTNIIHKFIHIETGLEVDVIPFGDISNQKQEIIWPDGNKMSILGLQEALANTQINKIDVLEIRIVDLPAFIALKILAWNERIEIKDLEDITFILQNYHLQNALDEERVFIQFERELLENKLEFYEAAIALFGRDIRQAFTDKTISKLREILTKIINKQNQYLPQFVDNDLDGDAWDEAFERIVKLFQALQYGLLY